jgi:hypothetical protein
MATEPEILDVAVVSYAGNTLADVRSLELESIPGQTAARIVLEGDQIDALLAMADYGSLSIAWNNGRNTTRYVRREAVLLVAELECVALTTIEFTRVEKGPVVGY